MINEKTVRFKRSLFNNIKVEVLETSRNGRDPYDDTIYSKWVRADSFIIDKFIARLNDY